MDVSKAISKRIEQLCDENDITINRLGTLSGVTQSTIFSIIQGSSKNPGIKTIHKLCVALDVTLYEFFDSPYFDNLDQYY